MKLNNLSGWFMAVIWGVCLIRVALFCWSAFAVCLSKCLERMENMLDTILSVIGVVLLAFSVYAVVMRIWVAK